MLHIDLFSGIGGFAYAIDQTWNNVEHIFCDNDKFCREILKKHWPESEIYNDIRDITDTNFERFMERELKVNPTKRNKTFPRSAVSVDIVTGGFPCQPFSAAGLRRGTSDERHLWPEMLRVIQLTKPKWVIAENVRGLVTWNEGLVLEQVCSDLEASGYEVQPLIIPALAVNAPHRRDRIWFIAHAIDSRSRRAKRQGDEAPNSLQGKHRAEDSSPGQSKRTTSLGTSKKYVANTDNSRYRASSGRVKRQGQKNIEKQQLSQPGTSRQSIDATNSKNHDGGGGRQFKTEKTIGASRHHEFRREDWDIDWIKTATEFCSVDDGLPVELDGFKLSKAQYRAQQLKAYGNAIVPQVAMEIMKSIREATIKDLLQ